MTDPTIPLAGGAFMNPVIEIKKQTPLELPQWVNNRIDEKPDLNVPTELSAFENGVRLSHSGVESICAGGSGVASG